MNNCIILYVCSNEHIYSFACSLLPAGVNVYVWGAGTCSEDKKLPTVWPAQLAVTEDRLLGHGDHVDQLLRLRSGQDILIILIILC